MQIRLVTICSGLRTQCRALRCLIDQLAAIDQVTELFGPIDILCPMEQAASISTLVGAQPARARIVPVSCQLPSDDPYGLKFLLTSPAWLSSCETDAMLYLDYDHLAYSAPSLPPCNDDVVWISSQRETLAHSKVIGPPGDLAKMLDGRHPNTSLLYLSPATMTRCAEEWRQCYEVLRPSIPARWREEIAFGWAARRLGCTVQEVGPSVQSSWLTASTPCSLFHYGGDSEAAQFAKGTLLACSSAKSLSEASSRIADHDRVNRRHLLEISEALRRSISRETQRPAL